jgi:hypothetical protein
VQRQIGVPVLTDVHGIEDIPAVASVVDVLQTPAFLCRQTDFIHAVASCGKPVNIKKGQFLAPGDMKNVVDKAREVNNGADNIMVCERGASLSATTIWFPICVVWPSCAKPVARWFSMRRTACSCRAGRVRLPAVNASLCRCWRGRRSPSAFPACSWKPIRARKKPGRMVRTVGRSIAWSLLTTLVAL